MNPQLNPQLYSVALFAFSMGGLICITVRWRGSQGLRGYVLNFLYGGGAGVIVCGALHLLGYFEAP